MVLIYNPRRFEHIPSDLLSLLKKHGKEGSTVLHIIMGGVVTRDTETAEALNEYFQVHLQGRPFIYDYLFYIRITMAKVINKTEKLQLRVFPIWSISTI